MEKSNISLVRDELVKNQRLLFRFAMNLTHNVEDARELVQDTALKILNKADRYTEQGHFASWAAEVMRNNFLNIIEYKKIRSTAGYEEIPPTAFPLSVNDPESEYCNREMMSMVDSLPPVQANTFSLMLEGYTYNEIANKKGYSLGWVKNHLHSARLTLRKQLGC